MWDDGFTVDDGPLQSLEEMQNARTFVNLARQSRSHGGLVNCHGPTQLDGSGVLAATADGSPFAGSEGAERSEASLFMFDVRRGYYSHPVVS